LQRLANGARRAPAQARLGDALRPGSQYASASYRKVLTNHGLVQSMSRKGNGWDNVVMERFFLNLKMERLWQQDYANQAEARADITDYIVNFYNALRLHSTLEYRSPNHYEAFTPRNPLSDCPKKLDHYSNAPLRVGGRTIARIPMPLPCRHNPSLMGDSLAQGQAISEGAFPLTREN
jgi:hypothetical protein